MVEVSILIIAFACFYAFGRLHHWREMSKLRERVSHLSQAVAHADDDAQSLSESVQALSNTLSQIHVLTSPGFTAK